MATSILDNLISRYPKLKPHKETIKRASDNIIRSYEMGGKVLVCGNGGSGSDAEHIVGELMKGFVKKRPLQGKIRASLESCVDERAKVLLEKLQTPLPAISLISQTSLISAFANDVDPNLIFAQQVAGYGKKGDVLIGMSTSGNSKNVIYSMVMARALGIVTIGLTGRAGGKMKEMCDILIDVPEDETFKVQELHLPIYHVLCMLVEDHFFPV